MDASQLPASSNVEDRRGESNSLLAAIWRQTLSDMQSSAEAMPGGLKALITHPFTPMPFGKPMPPIDGQLAIDAGVNSIGAGSNSGQGEPPNANQLTDLARMYGVYR